MRFRNLISDLAQNSIIILSSHIVSDIETISDEVAIMQSGTLITKGTQAEVVKQVEGKVFETVLESSALSEFKLKHLVVNTSRQKEQVWVRYISHDPANGSELSTATLEDAYLFLTHKNN